MKDKQLKIKLKKKRKDPTAVACHKSVCGTVDGALVWESSMGRKPVQTFDMMTITSLLQLVKIILCIVIYLMISTTSRALCLEVNGIQSLIEWFSFECRKTKTKVITLANHIGHR